MLRGYALLVLFVAFAPFCAPAPAAAGDEIQGVTAVWSDFVSALRRGDYVNAHGLFSAQSRAALSYPEFVREYGPLSAAREMILAKPDSLATSIDGDWGELTFGGSNPGTGRKFSVGVAFVRNSNAWGLVAARNEAAERVEANARALLRLLWENRGHGAARDLVAALTSAQAGNPTLRLYRLETDGARFVAFPQQGGLRVFFTDEWGEVRSAEQMPQTGSPSQPRRDLLATPQASVIPPKSAPVPEPQRPAPDPNALPELSDPGVAAPSPQLQEWAEPPMPGESAARYIPAGRQAVALPDTIR